MEYAVSLTPICEHAVIARIHILPHYQYGEPWVWTCTIETRYIGDPPEKVAFFMAAERAPTVSMWRALREAIKQAGYKKWLFERKKEGGRTFHEGEA